MSPRSRDIRRLHCIPIKEWLIDWVRYCSILFVRVTKEHRENLSKNAKSLCNRAKDKFRDIQNTYVRDLKKHKEGHPENLVRATETQVCLPLSWIPWNLFHYIHCTSQFTPKMKANAEPRLLSSLVWIDSGVVMSQHRLESFFIK